MKFARSLAFEAIVGYGRGPADNIFAVLRGITAPLNISPVQELSARVKGL